MTGFEPATFCSQSRRATSCATSRKVKDIIAQTKKMCNSISHIFRAAIARTTYLNAERPIRTNQLFSLVASIVTEPKYSTLL